MLKRLMIGLSILMLFSACQSEKSPTNAVNPNPYFTTQQSVKSSSKGCQECGDTSEFEYVEGSEKNKAIADLLKDREYKTLRKFLMENLQVRQDIPNAKVVEVQFNSGETGIAIDIPFVNPDGSQDKFVSVFKVIKGDANRIGALITTFDKNTLPSNIQTMAVYVDPCLYQQQNGSTCTQLPFWQLIVSVDSTGAVVFASDYWDDWVDCFASCYSNCMVGGTPDYCYSHCKFICYFKALFM